MNGYVHGVRYVNGFAYYKIILIVWDILAAAGLGVMAYFFARNLKKRLASKSSSETPSDPAAETPSDPEPQA